jgi:hypothetical protein
MKWHRTALTTFVLVVSWVLAPCAADACAVCYGAADSPLTEGVNNGILVLLAVVAVVQVGFVALFLSIRQRARRERRRSDRFQLIGGGAG